MVDTWRLLDTGLASATRNVALSRALLEARDADEIPSTLRFLRFAPSVLLGASQSAEQELDTAWCAEHGIAVQRRITGGRAVYAGERELGWELYLHRRDVGDSGMRAIARRVTHAAAVALAALGIDARYRAPYEIEVDGRAVAVTTHVAEGDAVLFQSVVLIDPDSERQLRALRVADLPCRTASLKNLLGRRPDIALVKHNLAEAFESEFDVELREGDLSLTEQARYQDALREVDTRGWIDLVTRPASDMPLLRAVHALRNGTLSAALKYEASTRTIRQVWFSGEFALEPRRVLADLEAALRDVPIGRLARQVEAFFASRPVRSDCVEPQDFVAVVRLAVGEPLPA